MKKIILTNKAPKAIGAYSQAVLANGILYVSGQIPLNPETGTLVRGIEQETHQVMKNIEAILKEENMSFSNIVKSTIYLKNMLDFPIVNDIYASYFIDKQYPARETIQVEALPKNSNIEISIIAHQD